MRVRNPRLAVLLTCLALPCSACRGATPQRPNVVLVIVDTLRADSVRPGDSRAIMPFLSDIASRSVYFESAYSPSSWTLPSMASLFLGKYPSEHRMGTGGWQDLLPDAETTLAEVLRAAGYVTAARVSHAFLPKRRIGQGFDDFKLLLRKPTPLVTAEALSWIDDNAKPDAPFFLYVHYIDPHNPYVFRRGFTAPRGSIEGRNDTFLGRNPGAGTLKSTDEQRRKAWNYSRAEVQRMRELYEGQVRYVDYHLGKLFEGLAERELLERSIVIVTSDHGEEFGEHGVFGHGASLFGAAVRVPLIVTFGDGTRGRVERPTNTGGLGASLLRELAVPVPASFRISAFSLRGREADAGLVYLDLPPAPQLKLHVHRSAVISGDVALRIADDGEETLTSRDGQLLGSTPQEHSLRDRLRAGHDRIRSGFELGDRPRAVEHGPAQIERLRVLGYVE